MVDLIRALLESIDIMPPAYARYQPMVVDGLVYFLENLPAERLTAIVAEQATLPIEATPDDRLVKLLRQCPTLHKLGQVVSHEAGLDPALRARLQTLEMLPPSVGSAELHEIVRRETGSVRGLTIGDETLAEGSVAVVVPFEFDAGTGRAAKRGVFKVLKPQAEERLREELAIWPQVGAYLEERSAHYGLPSLDFAKTLEGVRGLLLNEIRLDLEQQNLVRAQAFYANSPIVVVPKLLSFSTPRMTAMQRLDGRKVTDPAVPAKVRRKLARAMVSELIAKPFWTRSKTALIHADPHAGNLFATNDGRLGVLDWALVTELSDDQRASVVRAMLGALTLDVSAIAAAIATLGRVSDPVALRAVVLEALRSVRHGAMPAFDWLVGLLDRLARAAIVHFPEDTTLFRKSLLTLSGVIRDVAPNASLDRVLVGTGAKQFFRDLGGRPLAPIDSRNFGSHVSNSDIVGTLTALQFAPARYVLDSLGDLVKPKAALVPA